MCKLISPPSRNGRIPWTRLTEVHDGAPFHIETTYVSRSQHCNNWTWVDQGLGARLNSPQKPPLLISHGRQGFGGVQWLAVGVSTHFLRRRNHQSAQTFKDQLLQWLLKIRAFRKLQVSPESLLIVAKQHDSSSHTSRLLLRSSSLRGWPEVACLQNGVRWSQGVSNTNACGQSEQRIAMS